MRTSTGGTCGWLTGIRHRGYDGGSDWPGGDDGRAGSAHGDDLAEASDQAAAEQR